jgi:hemerythrin
MKTKFSILVFTIILLYCCQQKDWTGSNENVIDTDSSETSEISNRMVRKWFLLNRESDSIMASAQQTIQQQKREVESHPPDEREYINTCIKEAQQHLDQLKEKVKYIREFAIHIEKYDPALQHTIDSLKEDYLKERVKLEDALIHLR